MFLFLFLASIGIANTWCLLHGCLSVTRCLSGAVLSDLHIFHWSNLHNNFMSEPLFHLHLQGANTETETFYPATHSVHGWAWIWTPAAWFQSPSLKLLGYMLVCCMPFCAMLFPYPPLNVYFLSNDVLSDLNEVTCYLAMDLGLNFVSTQHRIPHNCYVFQQIPWAYYSSEYAGRRFMSIT